MDDTLLYMNTKKQYKKLLNEVEKEMSVLKKRLQEHQIHFNKQPNNFGYIADLNYTYDELTHINKFLKYVEIP